MHVSEVLDDLLAEHAALDEIVAQIGADELALATPSPRWTVADQLAHLTYFDKNAALAITDPDAFPATVEALFAAAMSGDEAMDSFTLGQWRSLAPDGLLAAWRENREVLADAARTLQDDSRIAWYGPSMGAKSFLTARLMETWAHGQDICDTVGRQRVPTDRLRHIAQLGYITRKWAYINRGMDVPDGDVVVELAAPSGETWTWGPAAPDSAAPESPAQESPAPDSITGDAFDFCCVVTQRRHVADTGLVVVGPVATDWMQRAQAFAGPATDGPAARGAASSESTTSADQDPRS